MRLLNPRTAHLELVRAAVTGRLAENDALLWMVLLHTHSVHLHARWACATWRKHQTGGVVILPPHTQRGVAAVIAKLWREQEQRASSVDEQRSHYVYWYWQLNTGSSFEDIEDVPAELRRGIEEFREALARDPRVVAVLPDN